MGPRRLQLPRTVPKCSPPGVSDTARIVRRSKVCVTARCPSDRPAVCLSHLSTVAAECGGGFAAGHGISIDCCTARRSSTAVSTRYHHAQMSARQGSAVPCRLLHTGHRRCRQAASQVSHTATDGGATTSPIYCWTPSIRCARLHGLELLAGLPPRTAGL